ncbi:MAG: helix-turn-helix domain-containing protein [Eggerthellaceae bacterium]|nr:helix-turn-helix domain-containing protein [Eggerthellaceae bacterium]
MCVAEKFEDLPMFLSPEPVAECTGMHVKSVRRCLINGTIPGRKLGSQWRVYKFDLLDESQKAVYGNGPESEGN